MSRQTLFLPLVTAICSIGPITGCATVNTGENWHSILDADCAGCASAKWVREQAPFKFPNVRSTTASLASSRGVQNGGRLIWITERSQNPNGSKRKRLGEKRRSRTPERLSLARWQACVLLPSDCGV